MKIIVYLEDQERKYEIQLKKFFDILGIKINEEDIIKAIQKALVDQ